MFLHALAGAAPAQPATGGIRGRVFNADTKLGLQGALVELPALHRQAYTDESGAFALDAVPPGDHVLTGSYLGVEPGKTTVRVEPGRVGEAVVNLRSKVYQLEKFLVAGEREGNAASITRQRNSANVRTVLALDALGSLPSENMGELLVRMPGVAGGLNEEGVIATVSVRGTAPALNTLTIDGDTQPGSSSTDRTPRTHTLSGALFEEIEVIKAPTPDMRADSLGGSINIRTRSALSLGARRRATYRAGVRWAPPFAGHIPERERRASHLQLAFGYQEVFDVAGGQRNLGLSLDGSYSEVMAAYFRNINYYRTNAAEEQAGTYQSNMADTVTVPRQLAGTLKLEYRISRHAEISATLLYNDAPNPFYRAWTQNAGTAQTVAALDAAGQPTGAGALVPGYTNQVTRVRGIPASIMRLQTDLLSTFPKDRKFTLAGKLAHDRWEFDGSANFSSNHNNVGTSARRGSRGGGTLQSSLAGVGWILDLTRSAIHPALTQTEGPDWFNADNYRTALLVKRDSDRIVDIANVRANLRVRSLGGLPASLKAGLWFNRERRENVTRDRRWDYAGAGSLARLLEPGVVTTTDRINGRAFPRFSARLASDDVLDNPAQWRPDLYTDAITGLRLTNRLTEDISAAYVQGETRWRGLTLLAGVRAERVEDRGRGNVQSRVLTTAAQRTANPRGAGLLDWDNPRGISGRYTDFFPSIHAVQRIGRNLQARLSWSNSIGRPAPGSLLPLETPNNTTLILTVNNPALRPQYSENWDAALEYYFEPIGQLTVGWFHKDIRDFIFTSDHGVIGSGAGNGYGGDYAGYTLRTSLNGGAATVAGWELSYQQELGFLPGLLRGVGVYGNFTQLETAGNYGVAGATTTANELLNFVPRTWNAGVSFRHRGLVGRVGVSYTSSYVTGASAAQIGRVYLFPRTIINTNLAYTFRHGLGVFADVANLTDEPQRWFISHQGRPYRAVEQGAVLTFGVKGAF